MKKPLLFIMITLLLSTLSVSFAYVPNGWVLTYPTSCWFYISEDTNSSPYLNDLIYYTKQWNSLPELGLYQTYSPSDDNIAMYVVSYDTGNYALAQHYSDDYHTATFYPSWKNLSLTNRREVIVHEIGHCLGLAHTQSSNNSNSIMRQFNFNGKPYPLSDDKAGISSIY